MPHHQAAENEVVEQKKAKRYPEKIIMQTALQHDPGKQPPE
jgi:hypothetical protein